MPNQSSPQSGQCAGWYKSRGWHESDGVLINAETGERVPVTKSGTVG